MSRLNPTELLVNKVTAASFKAGDRIVCVDTVSFPTDGALQLTAGKTYRVIKVERNGVGCDMVHVKNDTDKVFGYFALRFRRK